MAFLRLPGGAGNYASTPDTAALSVGEYDIMAYVSMDDWTPAAVQEIVTKNAATGNQRSYQFYVNAAGTLAVAGSLDGVTNPVTQTSTVATGFTDGTGHWIRGTRSSSSGDIKFYTSDDSKNTALGSISWTQLGTTVTDDTGAFFNSTAPLEIGSINGGSVALLTGNVYRLAVYNGYDGAGSLVFDANFIIETPGATSFAEDSANAATVTINGSARIAIGSAIFLQSAASTADASTYTFSAQNLGTADDDRAIIVAIISRKASGAPRTIDSVTIGGVSASIPVQQFNTASNTNIAGLAIATVPTGTTGDIVITFAATMVRTAIGLYRATGLSSNTPHDSDSSITNPSVNLDIPANGFAIGVGGTAANTTATWTELVEDFDAVIPVEAALAYTGASKEYTDAQTGLTLTVTWGSKVEAVGVFASWGFGAAPASTVKTLAALGVG